MKTYMLASIPAGYAQEAWRLSRDPGVATPLREVLAVDAPVNEMPCYLLNFEDFTILEREIFTTPRNHSMWARTSRVDDPLNFTVPPEFNSGIPIATIRDKMRKAKEAGQPQDAWRAYLPLLAHTSWTARMSLRDLVKMAYYFAYLATKFKLFAVRFASIAEDLMRHVPREANITMYKLDHFLHEEPLNKEVSGRAKFGSGWSVVYAELPLMLRAQLVRHRPLHFIDNMFGMLSNDKIFTKNLNAPLHMEVCAPDVFWRSIMAKRNCWIAQADLWQPLTVYFTDGMLPCDDGHCPYGTDNQLRMAGKDPNVVCPIYCDLHKINKAPYKQAMAKHAQTKSKWWWSKCVT